VEDFSKGKLTEKDLQIYRLAKQIDNRSGLRDQIRDKGLNKEDNDQLYQDLKEERIRELELNKEDNLVDGQKGDQTWDNGLNQGDKDQLDQDLKGLNKEDNLVNGQKGGQTWDNGLNQGDKDLKEDKQLERGLRLEDNSQIKEVKHKDRGQVTPVLLQRVLRYPNAQMRTRATANAVTHRRGSKPTCLSSVDRRDASLCFHQLPQVQRNLFRLSLPHSATVKIDWHQSV